MGLIQSYAAWVRWGLAGGPPWGRRRLERELGRPLASLSFRPRRDVAVVPCRPVATHGEAAAGTTSEATSEAAGETSWLRVYRHPAREAALRFGWAARWLPSLGLQGPLVQGWSLVSAPSGWRVVLNVSGVPGRLLKGGGPELAEAFGTELARMHAQHPSRCPLPPRQLLKRHLLQTPDEILKRLRMGPALTPAQEQAALSTLAALKGAARGPIAITHGDVTRGNVLKHVSGRLGWLDLDTVGPGPARFDLVQAHLHLVLGQPGAVQRLDEAYFAGDAEARSDWDEQALHWYRYELLRRTLLARKYPRPAADDDQRVRQARRLVLACAALEVAPGGGTAAEQLAEIHRRAAGDQGAQQVAGRQGGTPA